MFLPLGPFHSSGSRASPAEPAALRPRNDGQLPVSGLAAGSGISFGAAVRVMRRSAIGTVVPTGRQSLLSRIMRRGVQASSTSSSWKRPDCARARYRPAASQSRTPGVAMLISSPLRVHVPLNVGQPSPERVNEPSGTNWMVKNPNVCGVAGIAGA